MGGIVHSVLGIVQSVNVQIDFDPILFPNRARAHARFMNFNRGSVDFMLARTTCKRLSSAESLTVAHKARVVEWQTRTFEGRMPKGMRVQVPPRALLYC